MNERRYDLDWLRLIAFGVLIYFHAAIFFIAGGLPLIQNQALSPGLELFQAGTDDIDWSVPPALVGLCLS